MITMSTNLKNAATTFFKNFNFNGMAIHNGAIIATNSEGLFVVGGDTDNGKKIDAFIHIGQQNLGSSLLKNVRFIKLTAISDGSLLVTLNTENKESSSYSINFDDGDVEKTKTVTCKRRQRGKKWEAKIENINGCSFSISSFRCTPILYHGGY